MKSFTDLKQSEKLAEMLPIKSADMIYSPLGDRNYPWVWHEKVKLLEKKCYSLLVTCSIV